MNDNDVLLQVKNLTVTLPGKSGQKVRLLNRLEFDLKAGQIVCLVGRSGSGKTMTALSLVQEVPSGAVLTGEVRFHGEDLLRLPQEQRNLIRGKRIFTIFQNPMNSFNPAIPMGKQLFSYARSYGQADKSAFYAEMIRILEKLNISEPALRLKQYPFQLSGGMLQRMLIGLAIWTRPEVLIADEPTTALDPGIQKEILQQFRLIRDSCGTAILLITHHFGVVAELADHVLVLQDGTIIEQNDVFSLFDRPEHPYTRALLQASYGEEVVADAAGSEEPDENVSQ